MICSSAALRGCALVISEPSQSLIKEGMIRSFLSQLTPQGDLREHRAGRGPQDAHPDPTFVGTITNQGVKSVLHHQAGAVQDLTAAFSKGLHIYLQNSLTS